MSKGNNKAVITQGGYIPFPHRVIRSESFKTLSPYAIKLLCDLMAQYNGSNNGDLAATFSLMEIRGWKSKETLAAKLKELLKAGFIEITRQGGRNNCSLYALTFINTHYCGGKLDVRPTNEPSELWIKNEPVVDIQAAQKIKLERDRQKLTRQIMNHTKKEVSLGNLNHNK
jgi:hypothetical protein